MFEPANRSNVMAEYAFLFRGGQMAQSSPEQLQQQMQRWQAWMKELASSGRIKNGGAPLERKTGRIVKGSSVTDGPYAEKDVVGGFMIVEAESYDHAAQLATGCPIHVNGGFVEVREALPFRP
jgi:hypothetical protein